MVPHSKLLKVQMWRCRRRKPQQTENIMHVNQGCSRSSNTLQHRRTERAENLICFFFYQHDFCGLMLPFYALSDNQPWMCITVSEPVKKCKEKYEKRPAEDIFIKTWMSVPFLCHSLTAMLPQVLQAYLRGLLEFNVTESEEQSGVTVTSQVTFCWI